MPRNKSLIDRIPFADRRSTPQRILEDAAGQVRTFLGGTGDNPRKAGARKAAATRKRDANKRSAAARKAAATRRKNS